MTSGGKQAKPKPNLHWKAKGPPVYTENWTQNRWCANTKWTVLKESGSWNKTVIQKNKCKITNPLSACAEMRASIAIAMHVHGEHVFLSNTWAIFVAGKCWFLHSERLWKGIQCQEGLSYAKASWTSYVVCPSTSTYLPLVFSPFFNPVALHCVVVKWGTKLMLGTAHGWKWHCHSCVWEFPSESFIVFYINTKKSCYWVTNTVIESKWNLIKGNVAVYK